MLLGPPRLLGRHPADFAPERRYQLLALLGLRCGQWVARDEAAALLWPEHPNGVARRNLRHVVFKAREIPGVDTLETTEHALRWTVATDLLAFDDALRRRRPEEAVALRQGPPLAGLDEAGNPAWSEWLGAERARLDARWHQAAVDALAAIRDPAPRLALAEQLLQADPLDEAAMGALLVGEIELGHPARARQRYRDYAHRLAEELGIEPSHALRDLLAATSPARAPRASAAAAAARDDDFVGRRSELAELARTLNGSACRLLTVVGPGGIGKSRLARQALREAEATGAGPACWVELQDLDDAAGAILRLAQQLGAPTADGRDPVEAIARQLRGGPTLGALDNAEHLGGLAAQVQRLQAAAPGLRLLVTSRARLHVPGEHVMTLAGLPVPDDESRDLEAAQAFDAVGLFAARAAVAQPGFDLARQLDAVLAIVDATAGMPLAIELAAAWVRLLPPTEIARELRDSLELLERDPAACGALARPEHRSLRAVLEHSWELLAPNERDAMHALSVFRGGFSRAAASAVAGAPLPVLSSLVDKSFLAVDERGRFGVHPLIAVDAASRLAREPQRADAIAARHASYFADWLAGLVAHARGDHATVVEGVEAEFANCSAAWQRAVDGRDADALRRSLDAWRAYDEVRGRFGPGIDRLRAALDAGVSDERLRARLQSGLARLLYRRSDFASGLEAAQAGVDSATRCGDRRALAGSLANAGSCHSAQGQWALARRCFERTLDIARSDGEAIEVATALNNLGIVAKKEGRYDDALAHYAQALALERELEHHAAVARLLNNIGGLHMERDEWPLARDFMAQGVQHCEQHRLDAMVPHLAFGLGATMLELGELDAADAQLRRARDASRAAENLLLAVFAEANLARVEARRGDFRRSADRLRTAARDARAHGWTGVLLQVALFFGEQLQLARCGADAARVWRMVVAHPLAEAGLRDSATRWLAALPADERERAWADSAPPTLERVVADMCAAEAPPPAAEDADASGKR